MPHPLETYMRDVRQIHAVRAAMSETSLHSPIANLLNEVGDSLSPKVHCVMQLRDVGGGIPGGGRDGGDLRVAGWNGQAIAAVTRCA